jgi:hypothetical protein
LSDLRKQHSKISLSRNSLNLIRNRIQRKYWRHHSNDLQSLRLAVEKGSSPVNDQNVILFKRKGEFHDIMPSSTFAIGCKSNLQVDLWNRYASRAVCIDSTFCVSKHKFRLVTVLVLGPKEGGVPVASLITSKEDYKTLVSFFFQQFSREFRRKRIKFWWVMITKPISKLFQKFSNVRRNCCAAFIFWTHGEKKLKQLLQAEDFNGWPDAVKKAITREVMCIAKNVMLSRDTGMDDETMEELLNACNYYGLTSFAEYFQLQYMSKKEQWMFRFRRFEIVSTNNFCESYHKHLKATFIRKGYWHGRVDRFVSTLIEYTENKVKDYCTTNIALFAWKKLKQPIGSRWKMSTLVGFKFEELANG